jgi:hypothetical protein
MKRLFLALGALLLASCSDTAPQPRIACAGADDAASVLLIYGDSWSAKQSMVEALAADNQKVCAIGYPGANSQKLAKWVDPGKAVAALGRKPDRVLLIAGINDAAGHSGRQGYRKSVLAMASTFRATGSEVSLLELPNFREGDRANSFPVRTVQTFRRYALDGGNEHVVSGYRRTVSDGGVTVIDFDGFIGSYEQSPASYVDGRHLTDAEYGRLGRYLAPRLR